MLEELKRKAKHLQEQRELSLTCFADGYGYGELHFNHGFEEWQFSTGRLGGSFTANEEFINKVMLRYKKTIEKVWVAA